MSLHPDLHWDDMLWDIISGLRTMVSSAMVIHHLRSFTSRLLVYWELRQWVRSIKFLIDMWVRLSITLFNSGLHIAKLSLEH